MQIILGSQSPRRSQLLSLLDLQFTCETRPTDEHFPVELQADEIPMYLARQKADAFLPLQNDTLLITADTIVWLDGQVLGKPQDLDDARRMLRLLSGKTHQVITGVCLTDCQKQHSFYVSTDVRFAPLTNQQIDYYVDTYRPLDKAGAYGIQEWIGAVGVEGINGSYYNVMGLPVQRLAIELNNFLVPE